MATQAFLTAALALGLGCLLATAALTPAVMRFARWIGAVDRGGYRKVFRGEMPLLGGLGIAIPIAGLSLGAGVAGHLVVRHWAWVWTHHRESFDALFTLAGYRSDCLTLALGSAGIVALGLVDDTRGMRARHKLLGQIVVALFVCLSGHTLTTATLPFVGTVEFGTAVGGLLTVLWVVGLINAFNLIDGIDGLASGIALVGAAALVALSVLQENAYAALAGAALAGCLVGFLLYNFPPARIFLGDTGSMFLGYTLALISLTGAQKSEAAVIVFAPILALSLPIFETLVSMLRRYIGGVPVFVGDNRHTHHRLLGKGYSQPRVVVTLCGTAALLAAAAFLSAVIPESSWWAWSPYALYVGTLTGVAWLAGYLRPAALRAVLVRRRRNRVFQALGHYASLRLGASVRSARTRLLLDLCRHELGLTSIEVRTKAGERLMASPEDIGSGGAHTAPEELLVKSSDGEDIFIRYAFRHACGRDRRQDVSSCLAGIFDGMKAGGAGAGGRAAGASREKGYPARTAGFGEGEQGTLE